MLKRMTASAAAVFIVLAGVFGIAGPAMAVTTYSYAVGQQTGLTADGAAVSLTIENPNLSSTHDGSNSHSIAELAVFSADSKNRIEAGWRKGATDTGPKMFVYHVVNNVPQGYNLCTDYSAEPFNTGTAIPSTMVGDGNSYRFQILHSGTNWWVAFNLKWVCYFPDSVWTSAGVTWNKLDHVMAYGEVAATATATACADMGNGKPATDNYAARVGSYALQGEVNNTPASFTTFTQPSNVGITINNISQYTFRYGWAGYNGATNTLPGNVGSC
jgi:Neprosin